MLSRLRHEWGVIQRDPRRYLHESWLVVWTLGVLFPLALALLGLYYLRRLIFRIPISGSWGEFGQCEAFQKGPNTWNAHPPEKLDPVAEWWHEGVKL